MAVGLELNPPNSKLVKQQAIWLVLLVAMCGYYMANQERYGTQAPVYYPRGEPLSVDTIRLGDTREAVQAKLHLNPAPGSQKGPLGWLSFGRTRVAFRDNAVWAVEGHQLEQGSRVLVGAGDGHAQVEKAIGTWVERPFWASKASTFYLQERVQVEYLKDTAVFVRLFAPEALHEMRTGPGSIGAE